MPIIDPFETKTIVDPFEKTTQTEDDGIHIPKWLEGYPNLAGAYGAGKALVETGAEAYAMAKGAVVGAGLGTAVMPGPGTIAGGLLGAGAGYMAAKGVEKKLSEPTKPLEFDEMGVNVLKGAGIQAAGGMINKALAPLVKKAAPAINKFGEEITKKAKDVLGITLSPAETTQSKTLALWESLMDKSPFSSSEVSQWRELHQLKPLLKAREDLLAKSGSPEAISSLGRKIKTEVDKFLTTKGIAAEQEMNVARNQVLRKLGSAESTEDLILPAQELLVKKSKEAVLKKNEIYSEIGELIPEGKAAPEEAGIVAEKFLKRVTRLPNQDKTLLDTLGWASKKTEPSPEALQILDMIKTVPKKVADDIVAKAKEEGIDFGGKRIKRDWQTLQDLRVQLNDLIKNEDLAIKMGNPKLKGQLSYEGNVYKELKAALDKDMEKAASSAGSESYDKLKIANAFFQDEYAPIWKDSKLIKQLAYKNPEEVINVVFRPTNITEIRKLKTALGTDGFGNLKKAFTNKILQSNKDQVFSPEELQGTIGKYGDEFLNEIYSPTESAVLKGLANKRLDTAIVGGNFLKTITESNPEIVVDSILGTMQKTSSEKVLLNNLLNIKRTVSPKTFESIRYQLADRLFQPNQMTDLVGPEGAARNIGKYEQVLSTIYSPEQVEWLKIIQSVGKRMVSAEKLAQNPSGTAQNIIAYGAFGATVNPLLRGNFSEFLVGVGSAVLAPKFMTKIYFSPLGRKYFTEGLVTNPNTKKGIEITTKLIGIMADKNERD